MTDDEFEESELAERKAHDERVRENRPPRCKICNTECQHKGKCVELNCNKFCT